MQAAQMKTGLCQCGCGAKTARAARNDPRRGWTKGHYHRYVKGHSERKKIRPKRTGHRWCNKCQDFRPLREFTRSKARRSGYQSLCKAHCKIAQYAWCSKNAVRLRRIRLRHKLKAANITVEEFETLMMRQNGKCAVCDEPETTTYKRTPRSLSIDHCHQTGKIRGLLCTRCNTALGLLRENIAIVNKLGAYIKSNQF
jgi:hypothetical protein